MTLEIHANMLQNPSEFVENKLREFKYKKVIINIAENIDEDIISQLEKLLIKDIHVEEIEIQNILYIYLFKSWTCNILILKNSFVLSHLETTPGVKDILLKDIASNVIKLPNLVLKHNNYNSLKYFVELKKSVILDVRCISFSPEVAEEILRYLMNISVTKFITRIPTWQSEGSLKWFTKFAVFSNIIEIEIAYTDHVFDNLLKYQTFFRNTNLILSKSRYHYGIDDDILSKVYLLTKCVKSYVIKNYGFLFAGQYRSYDMNFLFKLIFCTEMKIWSSKNMNLITQSHLTKISESYSIDELLFLQL